MQSLSFQVFAIYVVGAIKLVLKHVFKDFWPSVFLCVESHFFAPYNFPNITGAIYCPHGCIKARVFLHRENVGAHLSRFQHLRQNKSLR